MRRRPSVPGPAGVLVLIAALSGCSAGDALDMAAEAGMDARRSVLSAFVAPAPQTRALGAPLAAAARPVRPLSRRVVAEDLLTGEEMRLTPRPVGARSVEVTEPDGCRWRRDDWFAPSTWWRGCGEADSWRDGRAELTGGAGLWPLRLGAEARWRRRAESSAGRAYVRDTVCRVEDAVELLRPGREPAPVFVVACDDGKRVRTTWWAPGEGPLAFRVARRGQGVEQVWVAR